MTDVTWEGFHAYSELGSTTVQSIVILLMIVFNYDSDETLFMMIMLPWQVFVALLLKNTLLRPRPFWEYEDLLTTSECKDSFGDPSGHAFCSAYFTAYIFFAWILPTFRNKDEKHTWLGNTAVVVSALILAVGHILMVLARVFLGAHSIDQILTGSLLGWWTTLMALRFFRPLFDRNMYMLKA